MQNLEKQGTRPTGEVRPEFFDIQDLSRHLGIKPSTLYSMVEEKQIPHYRLGKLIRFRWSEIDEWMCQHRQEPIDLGQVARKALRPVQKPKININGIVKKSIDDIKGAGYTKPHGKPDQVKGLGKEVPDGTV